MPAVYQFERRILFETEFQINAFCYSGINKKMMEAEFSWTIRDVNGKELGLRGDKKEERLHSRCGVAM